MIRPAELLRVLVDHRVRFIVVGGAAAVLQGAPINTLDIDIVYDRTDDNIESLMAALQALDAVFRTDPSKLRPNESHLRSSGHKLLQTRLGILDVPRPSRTTPTTTRCSPIRRRFRSASSPSWCCPSSD